MEFGGKQLEGRDVVNNDTGTVTITATQSEINTTFGASGLRYQGGLNFNGTATLTMTTNDQGFTGTGALQDQDTRTITVTAVNDAPVLANLGGTVTTNEQTAVLLDTNALVSDADLDALNGGAGRRRSVRGWTSRCGCTLNPLPSNTAAFSCPATPSGLRTMSMS